MKKLIAVLMTVCLIIAASTCLVCAYTAKEDASTKRSSTSSAVTDSALGSVLRSMLGDAADNLTNDELVSIAKKLFGDLDLSSLIGGNSNSIVDELMDYIGSVETTTEAPPATRPPEVTEEAATEETTTKKKKTETTTKKAKESTTAQAVQNYYYYYVTPSTEVPTTVVETTTVTYEYIPPETIYTDLLTTAYVGQEDAVDTSDGFGVKTVIGIIILIGSGAAVVFLCVRKRASY